MNGIKSDLKLSDVYSRKLAESNELNRNADAENNDPDRRRLLRDQAGVREYEATWIAHCIAFYGDLQLSAAVSLLDDPDELVVQGRTCGGENPWLRGLELLRTISEREAASRQPQSQSLNV